MKYLIYIDYMSGAKKSYEYKVMNAKSLENAINEADEIIKASNDPIYLTRIMKKIGKVERIDNYKAETYEAILCRRSNGWHRNTENNCENKHIAKRYFKKVSWGTWENIKSVF